MRLTFAALLLALAGEAGAFSNIAYVPTPSGSSVNLVPGGVSMDFGGRAIASRPGGAVMREPLRGLASPWNRSPLTVARGYGAATIARGLATGLTPLGVAFAGASIAALLLDARCELGPGGGWLCDEGETEIATARWSCAVGQYSGVGRSKFDACEAALDLEQNANHIPSQLGVGNCSSSGQFTFRSGRRQISGDAGGNSVTTTRVIYLVQRNENCVGAAPVGVTNAGNINADPLPPQLACRIPALKDIYGMCESGTKTAQTPAEVEERLADHMRPGPPATPWPMRYPPDDVLEEMERGRIVLPQADDTLVEGLPDTVFFRRETRVLPGGGTETIDVFLRPYPRPAGAPVPGWDYEEVRVRTPGTAAPPVPVPDPVTDPPPLAPGPVTPPEPTPTPEPEGPQECGSPGRPPCKIDETGTPAATAVAVDPALQPPTVEAEDLRVGGLLGGITGPEFGFIGAPPLASCQPIEIGTLGAIDPCPVVDTTRSVMAYLWALMAAWIALGMVRKTVTGSG